MRRTSIVIFLSLIIIFPVMASGDSSSETAEKVLLYEINPFGNYEGLSLFNYGDGDVDLKGWSISDGEGTLTFISGIKIASGARLTLVKAVGADDWFSGRGNTTTFGDERIQKKGSFILANTGDDISLYRNGILRDAVCYGEKHMEIGWSGDPVPLPTNKYVLRIGSNDTDTAADWIYTKPGLTNHSFDPELYFDSVVSPFSFPESQGTPIFKEIENADREILIANYLLTNVNLVALLCGLSAKGVKVRILLDGAPLGNDISTELTLMRSLVDAGAEVYLIDDPVAGNYERYAYFHNKYAVIDGKKVIVTSENWTAGNLSENCSNRGWGAAIESGELSEYMRDVFFSDMNLEFGDVRPLLQCYPGLKPYAGTLTYSAPEQCEIMRYEAKVMPIISPDYSLTAMRYFIENAGSRVYSEQMDLGSSFCTIDDRSPVGWLSAAAERGVDARFILDASAKSRDEIINMINSTTGTKAISIAGKEEFSLIHNKGVIIDDKVWVGSVNWTESSFQNNREFAVVIDSPEVTDFFAGLFIDDWGVNEHTVAEIGLEITIDTFEIDGDRIYVFTVSGPEDSAYTWDVLGDGTLRTSPINKIVCKGLHEGVHTVRVSMDGTGYTAVCDYAVEPIAMPSSENKVNWIPVAAGVAAIAGVGAVIRRRNNNP
ncbi:cardiolipin synthase [Candidatus Methanoplasma termitum]|uniref:Cls2 protein n=2 Tax=Candidatus Methanoplasma termitum TaxID=1577791 RepID=A0A0A7LCC0_9ARCH|nr:cardiolipin synthase [Candidatus Methanoplasma termitum]